MKSIISKERYDIREEKMKSPDGFSEKDIRDIFYLMLGKLHSISINGNFDRELNERRTRIFDKNKPDSYFFENLVRDIHNAGMKAALVTAKLPYMRESFSGFDINKVSEYTEQDFERLLDNPKIIHHKRKLRDCIANAGRMKEISSDYGSFGAFLEQKKENFEELKNILLKFGSVGPAVVLDFLKDIGMDFVKPDVHFLRVFFRLGLIQSEKSFENALIVAEDFKKATNERLSVIDSIFWMYGGGGDGHLQKAMCNKNDPYCNECPITHYCQYYRVKSVGNP